MFCLVLSRLAFSGNYEVNERRVVFIVGSSEVLPLPRNTSSSLINGGQFRVCQKTALHDTPASSSVFSHPRVGRQFPQRKREKRKDVEHLPAGLWLFLRLSARRTSSLVP